MEILVKKPSPAEKAEMEQKPVWSCGISEFDWFYDETETCLIIQGQVTVTHDGGSVCFGQGDYVVFPQGLRCVWKVTEPVKKHYQFG